MFAFAFVAAALAATPPLPDSPPSTAPLVSAPSATPLERPPAAASTGGGALVGDELDNVRGGDAQAVVLTEQSLSAINSGRIQANVVGSGAVTIDGGALSNFDGVGNFVMNTGHLNNIQSSLSVTIVMAPAPNP